MKRVTVIIFILAAIVFGGLIYVAFFRKKGCSYTFPSSVLRRGTILGWGTAQQRPDKLTPTNTLWDPTKMAYIEQD